MRIRWDLMTPEGRNSLVAHQVCGYTPVMCDVESLDEQWVMLDSTGYATCRKCHNHGHIGVEVGGFEHQIIPPKPYTADMNAAMEIITSNKFYSSYIHYMRAKETVLETDQHMTSLYWVGDKGGVCHVDAEGSTACEAICIAALRAYGVDVEVNIADVEK